MNEAAYERLLGLLGDAKLPQPVTDCVLASADGPDALAAHLGSDEPPAPHAPATDEAQGAANVLIATATCSTVAVAA